MGFLAAGAGAAGAAGAGAAGAGAAGAAGAGAAAAPAIAGTAASAAPSFGSQALGALKQAGLNKIKSLGSGQSQPQQHSGGSDFQSLVPSLSPITSARMDAPTTSALAQGSLPGPPPGQGIPGSDLGPLNVKRGDDPDEQARAASAVPSN
jgi:hypothetical protein